MQVSFSSFVCMPGVNQDGDCADEVWRCGEQERRDVAFAEAFHYTVFLFSVHTFR